MLFYFFIKTYCSYYIVIYCFLLFYCKWNLIGYIIEFNYYYRKYNKCDNFQLTFIYKIKTEIHHCF